MDITRATELLQGLADGVNPLTGEVLPTDCICNQVEIVRAFHALLSALPTSGRRVKPLPPNAGKPWTAEAEAHLVNEFDGGVSLSAIAKEHGRTKGSIEERLFRLEKLEKLPFRRK